MTLRATSSAPVRCQHRDGTSSVALATQRPLWLVGADICVFARLYLARIPERHRARAVAERARQLKVKNGMELDAEMGPIVTRQALDRIEGYIALADLVPDMHRQRKRGESAVPVVLLVVGIGAIAALTSVSHAH